MALAAGKVEDVEVAEAALMAAWPPCFRPCAASRSQIARWLVGSARSERKLSIAGGGFGCHVCVTPSLVSLSYVRDRREYVVYGGEYRGEV